MGFLVSNLFWLFVLAVLGLAIMFLLNPSTGKVVLATIAGSTGGFGRWLRAKFPEVIMQHEIDKAGRDINYYWGAIEENQAHQNGLLRKKGDKEREVARLAKMSQQAVEAENDDDARTFIKDKKRVEKELAEINQLLVNKQFDIDSALANINAYEEQVATIKNEAESKSMSLQTKKVDVAISKKLAGLNNINGDLAQAKESLDAAMDKAEADIKIAKIRNHKTEIQRKYEKTSIDEETDAELANLKKRVADNKN